MGYLVTGGAGFLGSNAVDELVLRGHDMVVLGDLSSGKAENLAPREQTLNSYGRWIQIERRAHSWLLFKRLCTMFHPLLVHSNSTRALGEMNDGGLIHARQSCRIPAELSVRVPSARSGHSFSER
jgi:nucleoside-diphosphate-sugar epimerase